MERQRSFSFKSARFLVFSFTISSSLVFLTFFTIWVIETSPRVHQETGFQFEKPSLHLGHHHPIAVQSLTGFTRDFSGRDVKNSTLEDTHSERLTSGFSRFSILNGFQRQENGTEVAETTDGMIGNSIAAPDGAPGPSLQEIEVQSKDKIEVLETVTNSNRIEKIELPRSVDTTKKKEQSKATSLGEIEIRNSEGIEEKRVRDCDVTKGRWVYDKKYALYTNRSCPFIDEGFSCESNGRPDGHYMKWRWQPQECDIPWFNATKMLELIRGKRLVFVGDSINRNQWESMLCMLMAAVRDPKRVYETHGRRITKEKGNYSFRFVDFRCTVEYYVTHFLVHESKARIGQKRKPTLRIDTMDRGSSRWRGADILIFNTAHWWSHHKTKAGINYYQEGNQVYRQLGVSTAYRRALMTWASWVDKYINPHKTKVFFRNSSPSHFRGGEWNSGGHCMEAAWPLNETSSMSYPEKNKITEEIIAQMNVPVTLLNVTVLSGYRIDGHPSIYGRKPGTQSSSIQDCSHWCLPGVPDTWNELLYFHLLSKA